MAAVRSGERKLTGKQQRFVEEYLVDLNATKAAIRAGYKANSAHVIGCRLLADPRIAAAVAAAQEARSQRVDITQDSVLKQLWGVASANANELVEYRRACCRYCWGEHNRYQRTRGEFERDEEAHAKLNEEAVATGKPVKNFDPKGGIGYDKRRAPNENCPECFGEGVGYTFVHDTRALTDNAKLLYAGVKETKEGIEIKMHSANEARQMIGRHLGMFKDRTELSGPNGGPVESKADVTVKLTPAEAYMQFLKQR